MSTSPGTSPATCSSATPRSTRAPRAPSARWFTKGEQFTATQKLQIVSERGGTVDSVNLTVHVTAQPNNFVVKNFRLRHLCAARIVDLGAATCGDRRSEGARHRAPSVWSTERSMGLTELICCSSWAAAVPSCGGFTNKARVALDGRRGLPAVDGVPRLSTASSPSRDRSSTQGRPSQRSDLVQSRLLVPATRACGSTSGEVACQAIMR
jgi:hypothetical protein